MKSNQERSKECLPPKKREIPSSTIPSERHSSPTMAPPSDVPRSENLSWLMGGNSEGVNRSTSQSEYKPLTSTTDSFPSSSSVRPVSSLPTLYTSPQSTAGGTVHYTQLPPNLQFIASPYTTSYPGYIPSQIFPPPPPPPQRLPHTERPPHSERPPHTHTETSHNKPERSSSRTSMPPPSTDSVAPHHLHHRTAPSAHHHAPHSLHSQHALGHGMSQVLLQYADGPPRKDEGGSRTRELHNGELERGRRFESKSGHKLRDSYEARSRVLSSDYTTHDPSGLRISSVLMPNSHSDHHLPRVSPDKHSSSHVERGSIVSGKPIRTPSSSSSTSTFTFPAPPPPSVDSPKPPQTVIQTTHSSTEPLSLGLPFPQQPIIGYIAGTQHCLPQHLLIPGAQPVIIPVSGAVTSLDTSQVASSTQAAPFPAKTDPLGSPAGLYQASAGAVVQGQLHLPIIPASPGLVSSSDPPASASNTSLPHVLPPYFIKGSIIQLADGELKRVEDLKTEDFIQSAEISSELKIDSSTVERIEGSRTSPNLAVVQFAVGEHRTQVNVEVLAEYPFFVFGQGWSSCCPDRTTQLLELPCTKLSVGDVCISLTLKNVRNGSLKKPIELTTLPLKPPNHRSGQKENGINQRGSSGNVENGEVPFGEKQGQGEEGSRRQSGSRKRRWSAPEGRTVERSEEEPPVTLPKPNFIPHQVKVSIEGRSNIGK
ncbi:ataxin-1a [Periophthalmus magnuspinnatus]|uniref:ataxin-1a n=1 Tax=Periophthalmus magnuspinnatus TaxID=409849 RepID=UPI00145B70CD|nr:ataxin-1a [Periophthalmus magnuspinnatus]XP_033830641.1 ataxin-1a [Periophthalmus magnuspinnatus]XP_055081080.1 ataxin-1a [Periophthalmus magnuspinnatus]